jgi:outer membrane protein assembly factor BamA
MKLIDLKINDIIRKGTNVLFLSLLFTLNVFSQKSQLHIHSVENTIPKNFSKNYKKFYTDSLDLFNDLNKLKNSLIAHGYIAASIDSIHFDSLDIHAYLFVGNRFTLNEFSIALADSSETYSVYSNKKAFKKDIFNPKVLLDIYEELIIESENTGYPFAQLIPNSIILDKNSVSIQLDYKKGPFIRFNKLIIKGSSRISDKYLKRYLGIYQNEAYSEKIIAQTKTRIDELNFVKQIRSPEIDFYDDKADVYVYLNRSKANLFNGIVGLIPNENEKNLSLTGDIKVDLINNFNRAEKIKLNWIATGDLSQKLHAGFEFPFIFGSPFGVDFAFKIDKRDSSFVRTDLSASLDFAFKNNDKIYVYVSRNNSFILAKPSLDSAFYNDTRALLTGLGYSSENLDYVYNPSEGYNIKADIANGIRYSQEKTNNFFAANAIFDLYIPIYKKLIFKLSSKNSYVFSDLDFYKNELHFVGGFNSIRGFDEDVFLASGFTVFTAELRVLYERNSNLFVFADYARLITQNQGSRSLKFPLGFGAGTYFSTQAGIFSIAYALGKLNDAPVQLSNSKIHIGYVNRF